MDNYKAPKDKMTCILNCSKLLFSILNKASKEGHPAGSDEFLPLLIYTVIKSNFGRFQTNINYIQNYRSPNKLTSECSCYLTHLYSAVTFAENLDASDIKIDPEEFVRLMNCHSDTTSLPTSKNTQPSNLQELSNITESKLSLNRTAPIVITKPEALSLPIGSNEDSPLVDTPDLLTLRPARISNNQKLSVSGRNNNSNGSAKATDFSESDCGTDSADSIILEEDIIITEKDTQRFMSLKADDLQLKDIPKLLAVFKQLHNENIKLKETIEKQPKQ